MVPEPPETPERRRFLLTNLGILAVFILTLLVLLAAYPTLLAPPPTATPTPSSTSTQTLIPSRTPTITLTPTQTRTLRPTITSTASLTPSLTPTPSQTPTLVGPPTLTPARPLEGESYSLHAWSPEEAQQSIDLMEDFPNTLPRQARGENNENYNAAFSYAVVAESEGILRFPDSSQAKVWRWKLAYDLARTSDSRATSTYADLIARALNSSEVKSFDLPGWFALQEPRLQMNMVKIPAPSGYLNAYLLSLANVVEPPVGGSIHLLLLEKSGAYEVYPLQGTFNFNYQPKAPSRPAAERSGAPQTTSFNADLTGDGVAEITVFRTNPGESFFLTPPAVFSLAEVPPKQLLFNPALPAFDLGTDYINNWSAVSNPSGGKDLQFSTTVFPACPVQIIRTYHWTGEWFDLVSESYAGQPNPATLSFCKLVADHAANTWGPAAALGVMEPILPDWPPAKDENGKPYAADARDEWRYRLGVYQALVGNAEKARDYFNQVISSPATTASRWVGLAQAFLEAYQSPGDLYRACTGAEFCDARWALRSLVNRLSAKDYPRALSSLWTAGVAQRSSGYFDFDGDGQTETWFTVRHRLGEKLEFWILEPAKDHVEALFVSEVESDQPHLELYDPKQIPPVVILEGTSAFTLQHLPDSQQPYLVWPELPKFYPNRFKDAVQQAMNDLFSGKNPEDVQAALKKLQVDPGLLCEATWSCDQYFYILGLASELAGDQGGAVDAYLRLWWDYSKSPYTSLVRLKLAGAAVQPSITPSPTGAATNATPPTPTVSGTPATQTPTVAGTLLTATATLGTPGATPSVTLTPTPPTPYP